MRIHVADLLKHPGECKTYDMEVAMPGFTFGGEEVKPVSRLHLVVDACMADNVISVTGSGSIQVEFTCARCLRQFSQNLQVPIDERYVTLDAGMTQELADGEIRYYTGDSVDLLQAVTEALMLEIPMQSVCQEGCRGLCPRCGADLNWQDCKCVQSPIDPRLISLQ